MKFLLKAFALSTLFILLSQYMYSQHTIETQPHSASKEVQKVLDEKIYYYQLFQLDENDLNELLEAVGEPRLSFTIQEKELDFRLSEVNILAPHFQAIMLTERGQENILESIRVRAFKGRVQGEEKSQVIFTVNSLFIMAYFQIGEDFYYIKSLHHFTKNLDHLDTYVFYRIADVIPQENVICASSLRQTKLNQKQAEPKNNLNPQRDQKEKDNVDGIRILKNRSPNQATSPESVTTTSCRLAQIAADADSEFVLDQGGGFLGGLVTFGIVFNSIMIAELPFVTTFAVSFQISRIRVFNGVLNGDNDPFRDDHTPNTIICGEYNQEVEDLYATDDIPRDLIVLYSGLIDGIESFNACGFVGTGTLSGIGRLRGLCVDGVGIVFNSSSDFALTTGHEIGHIFGGLHTTGDFSFSCDTPPCNAPIAPMMCNGSCNPRGLFFDLIDFPFINAFLFSHGACLDESDLGNIVGPDFLCQGQNESYNLQTNHVGSGNVGTFPSITWTAGPGLAVVSQFSYSAVVTTDCSYSGPSWVQASIGGITDCTVTVRRAVQANCLPPIEIMDYTICTDDIEVITPNIGNGVSIDRLNCVSSNCSGIRYYSSPSYYKIVLGGGEVGRYTFQYTYTNKCGTFNAIFYVEIIDDKKECGFDIPEDKLHLEMNAEGVPDIQFNVYPNPSGGEIQVEYLAFDEGPVSIELINSEGQLIRQLLSNHSPQVGINDSRFDLSGIPSGVYFIHLSNSDEIKTIKFFKTN